MADPINIDPLLLALLLIFAFFSGAWYYQMKARKEATKGYICSFCFQPVNDGDRWWER